MCLIAIAWNCTPDVPLIVASNRDEFHARATYPLSQWADKPDIYAGRDAVAGGTWMGVSRTGRFAAVTNFREINADAEFDLRSRGELVSTFLESQTSPHVWMEHLMVHADQYAGFNLIAGVIGGSLCYCSNRSQGIQTLSNGVHSLSNGRLDAQWPKQRTLRTGLTTCLAENRHDETRIFALLNEKVSPPDHLLPDTGIGLDRERLLGPCFIVSPEYGTRSSTVVTADKTHIDVWERRYAPSGSEEGRTHLRLSRQ